MNVAAALRLLRDGGLRVLLSLTFLSSLVAGGLTGTARPGIATPPPKMTNAQAAIRTCFAGIGATPCALRPEALSATRSRRFRFRVTVKEPIDFGSIRNLNSFRGLLLKQQTRGDAMKLSTLGLASAFALTGTLGCWLVPCAIAPQRTDG